MDVILAFMPWQSVLVHIEHIVFFSKSPETHRTSTAHTATTVKDKGYPHVEKMQAPFQGLSLFVLDYSVWEICAHGTRYIYCNET